MLSPTAFTQQKINAAFKEQGFPFFFVKPTMKTEFPLVEIEKLIAQYNVPCYYTT